MNLSTIEICAEEIMLIEPECFEKLPPNLFLKIFSSSKLNPFVSQKLSSIVAHYCEFHINSNDGIDDIDEELFMTVTSDKIMPNVSKEAAMPLLRLLTHFKSDSTTEDTASLANLKARCIYRITTLWTDLATERRAQTSSGGDQPAKDGSDLPSDLQLELLDSCLNTAKLDFEKVREAQELKEKDSIIADLRRQNERLESRNQKLKEEVRQKRSTIREKRRRIAELNHQLDEMGQPLFDY